MTIVNRKTYFLIIWFWAALTGLVCAQSNTTLTVDKITGKIIAPVSAATFGATNGYTGGSGGGLPSQGGNAGKLLTTDGTAASWAAISTFLGTNLNALANNTATVINDNNVSLTLGAVAGNGIGLTALNASNISSGTLGDARLSANIPRLNAANTFTLTGNDFTHGLSSETHAGFDSITLGGDGGINLIDSGAINIVGPLNVSGASNYEIGNTGSIDISGPSSFNVNAATPVNLNGTVTIGVIALGTPLSGSSVSGGTFGAVNASNLTAINAANIASGILSDSRLAPDVFVMGNTITTSTADKSTALTASGGHFNHFTIGSGAAIFIASSGILDFETGALITQIGANIPANSILAIGGSAGQLSPFTTLPASYFPALTGDLTTASGALATTLATVNSNVGTFGSATQAAQVTVNGKGLTSAAASITITPAESSVTFTDIATGNVSTTKHGYAPKSPNDATLFLDGTGNYTAPAPANGVTASGTLTSNSIIIGAGSKAVAAASGVTTTGGGNLTLGTALSSTGGLTLNNTAGSSGVTISPPSASMTGITWTLQNSSDTFVGRATTDTLTNKSLSGAVINNGLTANGSTANNFSGSSGAFQTSTGTNTLGGPVTIAPSARTSGVASYLTVTMPADTGQTAATESIGVNWATATRTWADGTVALQRERYFAGPTYNKTTTSATFTDSFNLYLDKPTAGTGVTFTRPHTLGIIDSTSAASSVTGGLVIAATLGTNATSVGIGGGNINAGGTITGSNLSGTNTGDQTITLTGDVTGTGTGSFVTTLATVNTNTGAWGSATQVPQITINAKGLATAAANITITPAESSITTTDITTNNVSTTKHGFAPKGDNDSTHFLDGTGSYSGELHSVGFTVDGGGAALATGVQIPIKLKYGGTLVAYTMMCSPSGSITFNLFRAANSAGLPTASIINSAGGGGGTGTLPAIASGVEGNSTSFTSWGSTTITALDNMALNLTTVDGVVTKCTFTLWYK